MDLRVNNGFHGTKFDIFWNELSEYFDEEVYYCFYLLSFIIINFYSNLVKIFFFLLDYSSRT